MPLTQAENPGSPLEAVHAMGSKGAMVKIALPPSLSPARKTWPAAMISETGQGK